MPGAVKRNLAPRSSGAVNNHDGPLICTRNKEMAMRYSYQTLRALLMDIPLLVLLVLTGTATWLGYVHDHYWAPQIKAMKWTDERKEEEFTYYNRLCDANDISTQNGNDLFLPEDASSEDAYQHQLKHGFTIFKSVLSLNTTKSLRDHIISRNQKLTKDESLLVLEAENRVTFSPSMEEPAVQQAIMELTNHKQLKAAVEKVMGPDPALIEFAPITNQYGAEDQGWHPDVETSSSATRYSHTFGPCYSIFVQLQNTTKEIGATSACPGTHFCTEETDELHDMCTEHGLQVVDEDLGYWPAGDALFMNMNSWHRGSAHKDPDGEDRVLLILTFAPKPKEIAESRLISLGATYHLPWSLWGHTWSDLMKADTIYQPWAMLRSLGLYKPHGASWGIDYISSAIMRIANEDTYFEDKDLQNLLDKGGIPYLPSFLQGDADMEDDMTWYKFLLTTFINVEGFLKKTTASVMIVYYMLTLLALRFQRKNGPRQQPKLLPYAFRRPIMFCGLIYLGFLLACYRVDSTQWAKDIKNNRLYIPTEEYEQDFIINPPVGPTTFPNRNDVLVEQRLGYAGLGLHKDYVTGHHGNVILKQLVQGVAPTYDAYPKIFRDASAQYIVDAIALNSGRFLEQGAGGRWHWGSHKEAVHFTKKELAKSSSPLFDDLMKDIRYAIGGYRYGIYRKAALARKHMTPFLHDLGARLFFAESLASPSVPVMKRPLARHPSTTRSIKTDGVSATNKKSVIFQPSSNSLPDPSTNGSNRKTRTPSMNHFVPEEPTPDAWISEGDHVEGLFEGHWYFATVIDVRADGTYLVEYADGDEEEVLLDADEIRWYIPFEDNKGEIVECRVEPEEEDDEHPYERCEVLHRDEDGFFHVILEDGGEVLEEAEIESLRRIGEIEEDGDEDEDEDE